MVPAADHSLAACHPASYPLCRRTGAETSGGGAWDQGSNTFARVEDPVGIKDRFDLVGEPEDIRAQFISQPTLLQQSDAVLTSESAAEANGQLEDLISGATDVVRNEVLLSLVDEHRMQVPVTSVGYYVNFSAVLLSNRADLSADLG